MERQSRDRTLMEVAQVIAKRGTCSRLQVGAVISRDGRIISTGFNGAPKGMPHCNHDCSCAFGYDPETWLDDHQMGCVSRAACLTAEHAETNAIIYAARHGVGLEGSELHVTNMPCLACSRAIVGAGIVRVQYLNPYRLHEGVEYLQAAGIDVSRIPDMV